jgi:hypothetical protein
LLLDAQPVLITMVMQAVQRLVAPLPAGLHRIERVA